MGSFCSYSRNKDEHHSLFLVCLKEAIRSNPRCSQSAVANGINPNGCSSGKSFVNTHYDTVCYNTLRLFYCKVFITISIGSFCPISKFQRFLGVYKLKKFRTDQPGRKNEQRFHSSLKDFAWILTVGKITGLAWHFWLKI